MDEIQYIFFIGRKQSGKSTALNYVKDKFKGNYVHRMKFASEMKNILKRNFRLSHEEVEGTLKDKPCSKIFGIKPRDMMLKLNYITDLDELFWVKCEEQKLHANIDIVLCDDLRFFREYNFFKDKKILVIRIDKPMNWFEEKIIHNSFLFKYYIKLKNFFGKAHISEKEFIDIPFNYRIINDGDVGEFYNKLDFIF